MMYPNAGAGKYCGIKRFYRQNEQVKLKRSCFQAIMKMSFNRWPYSSFRTMVKGKEPVLFSPISESQVVLLLINGVKTLVIFSLGISQKLLFGTFFRKCTRIGIPRPDSIILDLYIAF